MTKTTPTPTDFASPAHSFHRLRNGLWWTCVLLVLGVCAPRVTPGADAGSAMIASAGPGLPFAIADFDGDHRPDLASIQSGQTNSSSTNDYWVQVRLSRSGPSLFRLVAPRGGLRIEARDVNGDHAVDLILSTAWLRQPVAILLNDGHGSFLRVAPTAFPGAFRKSNLTWSDSPNQPIETFGISQEFRTGMCAQASKSTGTQPDAASIQSAGVTFTSIYLLASCAGRAPPVYILHI